MCGLISGAHVGRMFLVAFIFLVIFGALGFGIYFLYTKFLADSSQSMADLSTVSMESAPKKGQAVDIVIRDEELPADSNASQYYVGSNRFMLNSEDVGKSSSRQSVSQPTQSSASSASVSAESIKNENKAAMNNAAELAGGTGNAPTGESSGDKQFVPVRNLETLYNTSGKEAVTKNDIASSDSQAEQAADAGQTGQADSAGQVSAETAAQTTENASFSAADEQLDTLPDLDNVGIFGDDSSESSSYYAEDNINNDSDFATGGVRKNKEPPDVKDAELMAKAISTIISNET